MDLTPDLCRGGRALLAWTQRGLAERAHIAVSTVADFERGSRTPVPNSVDAITAALEAGGVRFDGGRTVLTTSTASFASLPGGRPIRWVDSADLCDWADRNDGRSGLPQLIDMLIRASLGTAAVAHFPAGDSAQRGGWDGTCDSPHSVDYVPSGFSGWELTAQRQRIAEKADEDFSKRAASGSSASHAETTFVFVVMRSWPKKEAWIAEHRAKGIFKDVRALDVDDLVHWLDAYPVVQQWLAENIGKRPRTGVASLEEMWQRWSLCTRPALTERLMLAGRDQESTDIHAWLNASPSVLTVQAESIDEAIAFLWAAISVLPEDVRAAYLTHTLYAESDDAVRELAVAMKALIVVMNGESVGFAQAIALKGHRVYVVLGSSASGKVNVSLGRVRRFELADALEAMHGKRSDARSLAARSGGSIAALRRIMADETIPLPRWAETASRSAVHAALFAGAWDECSSGDKAVIAVLAGQTYDEVSRELAPLAIGLDAPLRRSGTKIRLASGQDAWFLLAPRLTDADVTTFFEIARAVLSEIDPRFERRDRSRLIAFGEEKPTHSRELRKGIIDTLNVMATFPDRAGGVQFLEERVRSLIRELFANADAALWWSLRDNLPELAEAAPQDFLDAVEASLASHDASITVLLRSDGEGAFSREYISDLTSALERLAWSADYFAAAVMGLAGLAARDTSGNRNGNRPAASLRSIFLPWMPQTVVPLTERLEVVDQLRDRYREVAWHLMLSLLPKNFDTSSYSSEPIWRRVDEEREAFSPDIQRRSADEVLSRLLSDAGNDVSRWSDLLGSLVGLGEIRQREATQKLLEVVRVIDRHDERLAARDSIRETLHRHRQFAHTDWAIPESALAPLQEAFDVLTPPDIVERERWVFAVQPAPPNPEAGHDFAKTEAQNAANRRRVAREILAAGSADIVFAMAFAVEFPFQLGRALIEVDVDPSLRATLLDRAVRSPDKNLTEFGRGMIHEGVEKYGVAWAGDVVRDAIAANWPAAAIGSLLHGMPATSEAWTLASEAGSEVERQYWETTPWLWFIHGTPPDINRAAETLLSVGRAVDTVALIGQTGAKQFDSPLLLRALRAASDQLGKQRDYNDSTMLAHYCGLIFDQLVADQSVSRADLVALEWTYFGLLQHSGRDAVLLEAALASSSEFFVQVLSAIYRGDDDEGQAELDEDGAKRKSAIAQQSYALLNDWSTVPGADADGNIDAIALNAWVDDARALAVQAKRGNIIDQQIGMILSAAKAEPNGDWPQKPVRDVIERLKNKELDTGFSIGTRNRRGVTTRGPLDGGEQERDLKNRYDDLAKKFRVSAPRTAAILRAIGNDYKMEAIYMDRLADEVDLI
jgi:transcriptional regulator with XRE-family HTH domain